jgi:quercetin dioxygenase-like cupin family protein/catechol 2,3-dioxygenase-like lactoylglutathione lyase family enzyme
MDLHVRGVDHIYVAVSDLIRSERFYDPVMQALGYRKGTAPIAGAPHVHYFNRVMQYSLRPARDGAIGPADRYGVGALHHLCLCLADRAAVDEAHHRLRELEVDASEPRLYPEYRPDYYATFFSDPDGVRLELVCDTDTRRIMRSRWHEFAEFIDPLRHWRERRAGAPERCAPAAGNLWQGAAVPETGEAFQELARIGRVVIERIASSDQPESQVYDQTHDEWVVLLSGEASIELAGTLTTLAPGDYLLLPAHTPHRVLATSAGATWLAVHVHS